MAEWENRHCKRDRGGVKYAAGVASQQCDPVDAVGNVADAEDNWINKDLVG